MNTLAIKRSLTRNVIIAGVIIVSIVIGLGLFFSLSRTSNAVTAGDWQAGRIIDDTIFYNGSEMSVSDIQSFLNQKTPTCDTYGTQRYNSSMTNAQYAASRGWPGPAYVCLKDYYQVPRSDQNINNLSTNVIPDGAISAAQIIKNAAATYNISPKVLLVVLERESLNLIQDNWPLPNQYRNPMGYGCPDTAPCDPQYEGFYNQMTNAARQFKLYRDNPQAYRHKAYQNNDVLYQANNPSCGSSNVFIESQATAGLYNYTPYQPNSAALNNMYGTGDVCSAYGNRNFWRIFNDWFGTTRGNPTFSYSVVSKEFYSDASYLTRISDTPTIEPNSTVYAKITVKNTGNQVWYKNALNLGGQSPENRTSDFYTDGWLNSGRPAAMTENSVGGGENATFTFKMKAPAALGDYQEKFGVLIEGYRWFDGIINLPITVASSTPYYSAQVTSFSAYSDSAMTNKISTSDVSLYTGSKIYVKTLIKNVGNQPFPTGLTKIAPSNATDRSSVYADSSWTNSSRVVGAQAGAIVAGDTGTFSFSMTAPSTPLARQSEQFGLVIEGQRWVNTNIGTVSIQTNKRPPAEMRDGDILEVGSSILSSDERFTLILQGDGNLVLYKSGGRASWSSGTVGQGGVHLVMQYDGNLVLYRSNWTPVWYSRTDGSGSSALIPQSDGNLVLYKTGGRATWSSGTAGQQ
jgi:hypothetical protein